MLVFLLDCLRFSKLLKLHQIEDRISSNLLKRKQSSRKTNIVCRWLYYLKPAAHGACFPAGLLACSYAGYLAGSLAGNGLSAGSAARSSAGFL